MSVAKGKPESILHSSETSSFCYVSVTMWICTPPDESPGVTLNRTPEVCFYVCIIYTDISWIDLFFLHGAVGVDDKGPFQMLLLFGFLCKVLQHKALDKADHTARSVRGSVVY